MQTLFTMLITLQFLVVAVHDLIDIPGWTHGKQMMSTIGRRKLWIATAINCIFPGLAVAFAIYFWHRRTPGKVMNYWVIYCAITLVSATMMWYVPYFFGASDRQKSDFEKMYAGTRQVLPPRGDNPRPNLLHVCFHALFLVNVCLVMLMKFR